MPNFQLRLSLPFDSIANNSTDEVNSVVILLSALAAHGACTDWVVYEHEADNEVSRTHCHIYFFNWGLSEQTFRKRFAQLFHRIEKTDFAISTTAGRSKGIITLQYAVKYASRDGALTHKLCRGFDSQIVKELEKSFVKAIPAIVREPHQFTKWKLVQLFLEDLTYAEEQEGRELTKTEQTELCLDMLKEHKQVYSSHKVIEILETANIYKGRGINAVFTIVNKLSY